MEEIVSNINKVMKQTEYYIYLQFETICNEEKYTIEGKIHNRRNRNFY